MLLTAFFMPEALRPKGITRVQKQTTVARVNNILSITSCFT